ncbi:MAG: GNAT family N-acetyltransferase [Paramuribaculum sp.]|nr:GNAT family N-acetyltransferase [Paramuribaculum sp.]
MAKRDDIQRLHRECFGHSPEYLDMYFSRIYTDDTALVRYADDRPVSTLTMEAYSLLFHGSLLPVTLISSAGTSRHYRGRGFMTELVSEALHTARQRGDMLVAVAPPRRWLYFFFDRLGFSTIFLSDTRRFTSYHPFPTIHSYTPLSNPYAPEVFDALHSFELARPGGIVHTRRQITDYLDRLAFEPQGCFVAVGREDTPVAGMAWATATDRLATVYEAIGVDDDAVDGALQALRLHYGPRAIQYLAPTFGVTGRHLFARAMARIVNPLLALEAIAKANPRLRSTIRLSDSVIPENTGWYTIADGRCTFTTEPDTTVRHDLDVDVDTLARILFSSPAMSDVLGIPTQRTHISLI